MERQTKHRILGILVVIGLVIILLPLFQSGKEVASDTALVKAPPFPDQPVQVSATNSAQPNVMPIQQPVVNQQATANPPGNDSGANQQPDDIISAAHPSVVNSQAAVQTPAQPSVQAASVQTADAQAQQVAAPAAQPEASAPVAVVANQTTAISNATPASSEPNTAAPVQTTAATSNSPLEDLSSATPDEAITNKPAAVKNANYRIIEGVKAASYVKNKRHLAKRNHPATKAITKPATVTASTSPAPKSLMKSTVMAVSTKQSVIDDDGLVKLKSAVWVIQIGSFKNKANALRVVNQLRANGYKAFIQQISTALGDHTRVFVGPENKRTSARALADKLQSEMHIQGIVISYKPLTL